MAAFRGLTSISYYLPEAAFRELLKAYEFDIQRPVVENESALLRYAENAAGSIMMMAFYITCYKYGYQNLICPENKSMINELRAIAQVGSEHVSLYVVYPLISPVFAGHTDC